MEVNHTSPQVISIPWSEDVKWTRHSLCLFFSLLPHTRPTGRIRGQKDMYTQWPTTHSQYTFNYPGIFVCQVLLHNPVFTSGSLWIQNKMFNNEQKHFVPIQVTNHSPSKLNQMCEIRHSKHAVLGGAELRNTIWAKPTLQRESRAFLKSPLVSDLITASRSFLYSINTSHTFSFYIYCIHIP